MSRFADLRTRAATGAVLGAVGGLALWHGGLPFAVLVSLGAAILLWELTDMLGARRAAPVALAGGLALSVLGATLTGDGAWMLVAVAAVLALSLAGGPPGLALGSAYVALAAALLIEMRMGPGGLGWTAWLVAVVVATDCGGYFAGRLLGGPRLWARLSPGKTWSGALGALAAAALVGAGLAGLTGTPLLPITALALLTSGAAILGDLAESGLKRACAVKEAGRLLPGHGGLADRVDGLLAAALVVSGWLALA